MECNDFLYDRNIRNNPLPQHEDTFSAPYDQEFFNKFKKHLQTPRTDKCLEECFRQFDQHCKIPLQAQRFLKDPDLVKATCDFFSANEKWQVTLTKCLIHLFENRSVALYIKQQNAVKDELQNLIFSHFMKHPQLLQILAILWQNDRKIIDQNETVYNVRFEDYMRSSLTERSLRDEIGALCTCLGILIQTSYDMQNRILELVQQYMFKILKEPMNETAVAALMRFLTVQILQDTKTSVYLVNDDLPQTLLKYMNSANTEVSMASLDLISISIQHYTESIKIYQPHLDNIIEQISYLVTAGNADILERVARSLHRLLDGPFRGKKQEFAQITQSLTSKGFWHGIDGDYE